MIENNTRNIEGNKRRSQRFFDLRAGSFVCQEKTLSFIVGTTCGGVYRYDKLYGASYPGTMDDLSRAIHRSEQYSSQIIQDLFSAIGTVALLSDSLHVRIYGENDQIPDYLKPIYFTEPGYPKLNTMATLLTDQRLAELSTDV